MDPTYVQTWNLRTAAAVGIGLGLALWLGYFAGNGDFNWVGGIFAVLLFLTYVIFWQRKTWAIGLVICFTDLFYAPLDFNMGAPELTAGLGGLLFAVSWWLKFKKERPPVLEGSGFNILNLSFIVLLVYAGAHFWYNVENPYRPEDYALKNLAKTYVLYLGPLAVAAYFMNRPRMTSLTGQFPYRVAQFLASALVLNIGLRIFQIITVGYDVDDAPEESFLHVPVIGAYQNIFALRSLTPLAALFAAAYMGTKWYRDLSWLRRVLFRFVLSAAIFGALLSGGRATVVFVVLLVGGMLIYYRRFGLLSACVGAGIILVALINVFSTSMDRLPYYMQRSIAWAVIGHGAEAQESIDDSTQWRKRLFERAIAEWRSDPRIFWFGRGTYRYDTQDVIAVSIMGEDAKIETSLRRGATHNLMTDLLVTLGLVGFILYVSVVFSLAYFLWRVVRSPLAAEISSRLALVCLILHLFVFTYGLIGGSNFSPALAWLLIMLSASLVQFPGKEAEEKAPKILPPVGSRRPALVPAGAMGR